MSNRPRLAGDGVLLVPGELAFNEAGASYVGALSGQTRDPFGWTSDRLLLAESFARLALDDPRACERWFLEHGVIDEYGRAALVIELGEIERLAPEHRARVGDSTEGIVDEQLSVRWHLETLARLSEHRSDREWDPQWGRVVLDGAGEGLIIGGPHAGRRVSPSRFSAEQHRESIEGDAERRAFHAEQAELHAATAGWPRVRLIESMWRDVRVLSADRRGSSEVDEAEKRAVQLGSTWDEMVELERLIVEPRIQRAVERRFTTELVATRAEDVGQRVLVPRELRIWRSILDPIYLQLFEALRRITEGEPGAAVCRECGNAFLVLDARRRLFCNDRERFRHAQRERRRRLAAEAQAAERAIDAMMDSVERDLDEAASAERALRADLASPEPWLPPNTVKKLRRRRSR
jgi:hypothetical protein